MRKIAAAGALLEFMSRRKGISVQTDVPGYENYHEAEDAPEEEGEDAWGGLDVRNIECLSL